MKTYLVTGGSGFIGSNFIHFLLEREPDCTIINLDKLTYAGNPANLRDIEDQKGYHFVKGDICDEKIVDKIFVDYKPDVVINFAAESHVDRSIDGPRDFLMTDVFGVFVLLEACRTHGIQRFIQISTDEVYGSIDSGSFKETDQLEPSSPYSASKAGGDRLAFSYSVTYDLPVVITRASNNYGPYQYPEKLIPLFVTNLLEGKQVPVYGDGSNIRDWLHVMDHCSGVYFLLSKGEKGQTYNIGGGNEWTNMQITREILRILEQPESMIRFVEDRAGHDKRYSLDISKMAALGWRPEYNFENHLVKTVEWYRDHPEWWQPLKSGAFKSFHK